MRVAFHVVKKQNFAVTRGKAHQSAFKINLGGRSSERRVSVVFNHVRRVAALRAKQFPAAVDRDADQPGGKLRFPAESRERDHCADPRVLHRILCRGVGAEQTVGDAIKQRRVEMIEPAKRGFVAVLAKASDQRELFSESLRLQRRLLARNCAAAALFYLCECEPFFAE